MNPTELTQLIDRHELYLAKGPGTHGAQLLNLHNADLRGADFRGRNMDKASFSNCYLIDADFHETSLVSAVFQACDLTSASFGEAILTNTVFASCNLTRAEFARTTAAYTSFSQSYGQGLTMFECRWTEPRLNHTGFENIRITNTILTRPLLNHCNFRSGTIKGLIINGNGYTVESADWRYASIKASTFRQVRFLRLDLNHAGLYRVLFNNCALINPTLARAELNKTNIVNTEIQNPDLYRARIIDCKLPAGFYEAQSILPAGRLIGWKQLQAGAICKLEIPASARRSSAAGRKCRASKAKVLAIWDRNGQKITSGSSMYAGINFEYIVGQTVKPLLPFDTDPWNECSDGIHFFITKSEAENY